MPRLSSAEKQHLLQVARHAIAKRLGATTRFAYDKPAPQPIPGTEGVFVTLTKDEELRGCIGCFSSKGDLSLTVARLAVQAASEDPRFPPLSAEEFLAVRIEISLLSKPVERELDGLVAMFPSKPGVTIRKHYSSATFLPQVWDELPDPEDFMGHLCRKAGLSADAWKDPGMHYETYTVDHWAE